MRNGLAVRSRYSSGSFELYSWFFMRVSAVVLVLMVILHFAITHIINDVAAVDYNFVVDRWASPFWRIYDVVLLLLALLHGTNGARIVIEDYVRPRGWRVFAQSTLYVLAAVLLIVGALIAFTFTPQTA
jgi:succinate dehydrogenase / fumarate reductase, membrane anchor subunit